MRMSVSVAVLGCLLAGCAASQSPKSTVNAVSTTPTLSIAALRGADWQVFDLNGQPALANHPLTVNFADTMVAGSSGCNRYGGSYQPGVKAGELRIGELASTRMACLDGGVQQQEDRFLRLLGTVNSFALEDGVLILRTANGESLRAKR